MPGQPLPRRWRLWDPRARLHGPLRRREACGVLLSGPTQQASMRTPPARVPPPPRALPKRLGRKPRAGVSDAPPRGRGPSRTLTFRRRVLWGGRGSHRGRRRRRGRRGWLAGRRRRGRLARRRRRRVRLRVEFRLRVPARRAAPGTRRRELQDRPTAGYRPGLLPHREPKRELLASGSREGRRSARRCVINIHTPRHRLLQGLDF